MILKLSCYLPDGVIFLDPCQSLSEPKELGVHF